MGINHVDWGDVEQLLKSQPARTSAAAALPTIPSRLKTTYPSFVLWLFLGLILNVVLIVVVSAPRLAAGPQARMLANILTFAIPLVTVHLCFPASAGRRAKAPMLLGSASIAYACGRALYFALTKSNHGLPGVVLSDAWYEAGTVAAYPLVIAALLCWPSPSSPPSQRFRNLLDLVVGGAGLWAFSWVFVIYPEIEMMHHGLWGEAAIVSRPIFALLIVVCIFQFFGRRVEPRFRNAAWLLLAGLFVIIASEVPTSILTLKGYTGMFWLQRIAWPLSCTLFNLAGYAYCLRLPPKDEEESDDERVRTANVSLALSSKPWFALAPYTLVPAVAFLILFSLVRPHAKAYELGILLCATVMIGSLLLRQVLTIKDNAFLITRLQDAFHELSGKSLELKKANVELEGALSRLESKNSELGKANAQLAQLVTIDGMTGLENHRAFQQRLRLEVDAAKRHRHPLSLIMADVDYFKRYNDEFGHPAGDEILRQIAKAIMDEVGENAYPARYGGEEFSVVLPYLTATEALAVAERVGRAVSNRVRVRRRITMSFGVATMEPHWTAETLVNEADRALYAAKAWGRNRAVLVTDLDRQRLSLDIMNEGPAEFDPNDPMGLAAILSAGLRNHPQALGIEPDSQLAGGLLGTLELKDVETRDHSERVMWYAMRLAQSVIESGISTMTQQELRSLAYGSLLHDIGKIGVPEHILKYPGTLDLEMRAVIREHPRLGAQIVQRFPTLDMALAVIRNHHERWDGRGYPSGLRGTDIPLVARIFTVVDALEAMTSKRPYSEPIAIESVTERLMAGGGTNYDPAVLRAYALVPAEEWIRIRERESSLAEQIGQATAITV